MLRLPEEMQGLEKYLMQGLMILVWLQKHE